MNALMRTPESDDVRLNSTDINAISTFAQNIPRLPPDFVRKYIDESDDLSNDAKEIIMLLLSMEGEDVSYARAMIVTREDQRQQEIKKVAKYFADWATGRHGSVKRTV